VSNASVTNERADEHEIQVDINHPLYRTVVLWIAEAYRNALSDGLSVRV